MAQSEKCVVVLDMVPSPFAGAARAVPAGAAQRPGIGAQRGVADGAGGRRQQRHEVRGRRPAFVAHFDLPEMVRPYPVPCDARGMRVAAREVDRCCAIDAAQVTEGNCDAGEAKR